jgi:hypothetical protein
MSRVAHGALCTWGLWLLAATASAEGLDQLESVEDWDAMMLLTPPEGPIESSVEEPAAADKKRSARKSRKGSKKKTAAAASGYARMRESWHTAVVEDGSWGAASSAAPPLTLRGVGRDEPVVVTPSSEQGGFDAGDITFASQLLGSWEGGPEVHPRLLDLIYQAARHFRVGTVNVVSGIRRDRQGSRHSHGLAADIVLPGVSDEDLAAFFREQGFVGVGTYPKAGFVHIDVREQSYFWVDKSAPGSRRSRMHQVRADEAREMDVLARERGVAPIDNPAPLKRVLHKRAVRRNERSVAKRKAGKERAKAASSGDKPQPAGSKAPESAGKPAQSAPAAPPVASKS